MTTTPASPGRVNIALTGQAEIAKGRLKAYFTDTEGLTLMRLGAAYAIRCGLSPEREAGFGRPGDGQNANIGSFDPTGEIRALILALFPDCSDPYVAAETLMSLGLVRLDEDIRSGRITTLADAMYSTELEQ